MIGLYSDKHDGWARYVHITQSGDLSSSDQVRCQFYFRALQRLLFIEAIHGYDGPVCICHCFLQGSFLVSAALSLFL
jgi:hypothetical protein